jgi:hypothetical protein
MDNPETLQHCAQETERRYTKQKAQKIKMVSNSDPTKIRMLATGKQFLFLIIFPPCYSYRQVW